MGDDTRFSPAETAAMRRALALARRGAGHASPNPMVGAVILRDGAPAAEGWHRAVGGPHAEVEALRALAGSARGTTLVVTLEPCNHHGRTPPCTEAILAGGVRRVVVGMVDPDPRVAGRGIERLRAAGIEVETGLLQAACERLNEPYIASQRLGRPHVHVKAAVSLDGRIATAGRDSGQRTGGMSGAAAHRAVHALRQEADAILVGVGTVRVDDPRLTVRGIPRPRHPLRVVLDDRLDTPPTARLLSGPAPGTLLVCRHDAPTDAESLLCRPGVEVVRVGRGKRPTPAEVLHALHERGVRGVLVEGGSAVIGAFFAARLVDRLTLFVTPYLFGVRGVPLADAAGADTLAASPRLVNVERRMLGPDVLVSGHPLWPEETP